MSNTRRMLTALLALTLFTGVGTALEANIQPANPDDITLDSNNNHELSKDFDGAASTGSINSYTWDLVGSGQSDTGPTANFDFDRDSSGSNTIRLTVANETHSDVSEVTQVVHDVPTVSVSASTTSINEGDSVDFSSTVTNEFDDPASYSWTIGGTEKDTSATFSHTFSSAGTYSVKLTVTDTAGKSASDSTSISVSSTDDSSSGGSSGSNSGGSGIVLPDNDEDTDETSDNETMMNGTEREPQSAMVKTGLSRAKGLTNNSKLQTALEKVLENGNMTNQARENLLDLSEAIASDTEVVREMKRENNQTTVSTQINYSGEDELETFVFYDQVPKMFANHTDHITVNAPDAAVEIIESDPEYMFSYTGVSSGDSFEITYESDNEGAAGSSDLDSLAKTFGAEVYGAVATVEVPEAPKEDPVDDRNSPIVPIVTIVLLLAIIGTGFYFQDTIREQLDTFGRSDA